MEKYIKWSFNTASEDELSRMIIKEEKYDWIKVHKERLGIKIMSSSSKETQWVDISEQIPYGCQLEYTRVRVLDETWYTFGLEWFGQTEIEVDPGFIQKILDDSILEKNDSMGYAEFLTRRFN